MNNADSSAPALRRIRRTLVGALLLVLSAPGLAQVTLETTFTGPTDGTYTPGSTATFTIEVTNTGGDNSSPFDIATTFPSGASVQSALCADDPQETDTVCDATVTDGQLASTGNEVAATNGSITIELDVAFESDSLSTVSAAAEFTGTDFDPPVTETVELTPAPEVSLATTFDPDSPSTGPTAQYVPGGTGTVTITVSNGGLGGPSDAVGAPLSIELPAGIASADWSCTSCSPTSGTVSSGFGSTDPEIELDVDVASGSSADVELTLNYASDSQVDPLVLSALVAAPTDASETNPGDESAETALARDAITDLGVDIDEAALPASYVPGTGGQDFSVELSNDGPSDAFDAGFALAWPDAVSAVDWSCDPASACTPDADDTGVAVDDAVFDVDIASGGTVTLNATLDFDSGARADLVLEPAIVPASGETDDDGAGNPAGNTDTVTLPAERRADIAVQKSASVPTVGPGGSFVYDVRIENLGPSDLGPDPDDDTTVQEIGLLLDDAFPNQLRGDLQECVEEQLPCWRVCANDGAVAGDYGPQTVDDNGLEACPTTIVTGSGDIDDQRIALAAGSATTLRAFVRVEDTASGTLQNTASVRLYDGPDAQVQEDTAGGGTDSSSVELPIELASDVSVEKTDGTTRAIAGESHTYTVDVANTGFISASGVSVVDEVPLFDAAQPEVPGFVPGTVTWQCRAFGGACCNSNSSTCGTDAPTQPVTADVLSNAVDLPGQSQVRFTITGTLDPRSTGTLSNTARAEMPASVGDPNASNNADTDADTEVQTQAAVQVDKTVDSLVSRNGDDLPPFDLVYRIEIANDGPGFLAGAEVVDALGADVFETTRGDATWTCTVLDDPGQTACASTNGSGPLNGSSNGAEVDLDPGGRVAFTVSVSTGAGAAGTVENTAEVRTATAGTFADSVSTSLRGTAKLAISATDNRSQIAPGDTVDYVVRVENEGPDDVFGANVRNAFPPVVESVTWQCDAATPIPGDLTELGSAGFGETATDAVVTSPDGRHAYAIGTEADSLFVFARNSVPGANFGSVVGLETEINGIDDAGDAGGTVTGMERPLDIAISPDGLNVYALAKPEASAVQDFSGQYDPARWNAVTQSFGCGSSSVMPGADEAVLKTANGCAAIFAAYIHDGADEAGTVVFDWQVEQDQSHQYVARVGLDGETLETLTSSRPASGTFSLPVAAGDRVRFQVSKSDDFGVTTLRITNFRFIPEDQARPSLVAFGRSSLPEAGDFGELSFLGSVSDGLPGEPAGMAMTDDKIYVYGSGDPEAAPGNAESLIAIFDRSGVSGVPAHEASQTEDVPAEGASLITDAAGDYLFAGGAALAMFSIDPEIGQVPAGRLTFLESVAVGDGVQALTAVDSAPQIFGRATDGGDGQLFSLFYLDSDGNPAIDYDPLANLTAADMELPAGVSDPLSGRGRIDVAADGEHLVGVSDANDYLYLFRRDPVSGALAFQEGVGPDRPLRGARGVAFAPDGRHVLVAAAGDEVAGNPALAIYSRRAPDPLFAFLERDVDGVDGVPRMRGPNEVAISPDGAHVYAVSLPDDSLLRFDRDPRLGLDDETAGQHLQFVEGWFDGVDGVSGLAEPRRILISPDGESLFVSSQRFDTIAVFSRDADPESAGYGSLTFLQRIDNGGDVGGIAGAQGMAMDPEGRHLYVAGSFGDAIARFERQPDGTLAFAEQVVAGEDGVVDLDLVRDLAVTPDGSQLLAVSPGRDANALVVFDRDNDIGSDTFGQLTFVQSQRSGIGVRPVSLAIPGDGEHVYVTGQNSDSLAVLRRVTDPSSSAFGQVQPLDVLIDGSDGISFMNGPRDVVVSPDGKRIYVAAEFSNAVLVFDRDLNSGGANFGLPSLVEVRRNNVLGVAGLREVRSLAVSFDSRNVYAAGFADDALASFRLGVGSVCTAGGSGNIDDRVDIGVNGTLIYRASGVIRPDATGQLVNEATACLPDAFVAIDAPVTCSGDEFGDGYDATDTTELVPQGDVSVRKDNEAVSVTAGERTRYTITINNAGPSSLVHEAGSPLTVTDPLDPYPDDPDRASPFVADSAEWTCAATGSGSLEFVRAWRNLDPADNTSGPFDRLAGITGLALVPTPNGRWLAGASVLDDAVSLFSRDPASGELVERAVVDGLEGPQSLVASADGAYLYVASRISDSVTVFAVGEDAGGAPTLAPVQTVIGRPGLDQAVHVALSADQATLYVAGANDDAVAAFARDADSGVLTWIGSVENGVDGVAGLSDVSHVVPAPDGEQVYALSPTTGSIAVFDRAVDGSLSWRRRYDGMDFPVDLAGASSAVFDAEGRFLYVAAQQDSRIVVLARDTSATATRGELAFASAIDQSDEGVNGLFGVARLAISGDGVHVYATSPQSDTVAWFIRDGDTGGLRYGGLRGSQDGSVPGLDGVTGVVVDDVLSQVWVAGTADAAIGAFRRQADSFCPASGNGPLVDVPFNVGAGGSVVFTVDVDIAGDATGSVDNTVELNAARDTDADNNAAVASSPVSGEADLAITKTDGLAEIDGLEGARDVAAATDHVYVAGAGENALTVLSRRTDPERADYGETGFVQALRIGASDGTDGITGVTGVVLSADGAHLYSASPIDNAVAGFARDAVAGTLEFRGLAQNGVLGVNGIAGARDLAVSPDDRHVYVAGEFSNAVAVFGRDADPGSPDFGQLAFAGFEQNGVDSVGGVGAPVALAVSADGLNVYVAGAEQDTLATFRRNRTASSADFGLLEYRSHFTNNQDGVAGLAGVRDVAVSANGEWVFALGAENGTVAVFDRDASTGELVFDSFIQDGVGDARGLTAARSLLLDDATGTLYVSGPASIARYAVDLGAGVLTFVDEVGNGDDAPLTGGEVFGLDDVAALALSPDGDHVYAAAAGRDAALTFQRPVDDSSLQFKQILIEGQGGVAPGSDVEYVITVENLGPSEVSQARVVDQFPQEFESVAWVCSAVEGTGAECLSGGDGDIDTVASLPSGGRIVIRASGRVAAGATGRLVNTATVTAVGVTDPVAENDSATDDDTVLSPSADLRVDLDNGVDEITPGADATWEAVVTNNGPSSVRGVFVEDVVPAALFDVEARCTAEPAAGTLLDPIPIAARGQPVDLAIPAAGRSAFAVGGDRLEVFRRDPLTGGLVPDQLLEHGTDGVTGMRGAADVAVTSDGRFVYVAGAVSDAIVLFAPSTDGERWRFIAAVRDGADGVEGIGGVNRLLISPDGTRLYAAGARDEALAVFEIDATSGRLTPLQVVQQGQDGVDGLAGLTDLALARGGDALLAVAGANQSLALFERDPASGRLTFADILLNDDLLGTPTEDALSDPAAVIEAGDEVLVASTANDRIGRFLIRAADPETPGAQPALAPRGRIDADVLDTAMTGPVDLTYVDDQRRLYVAADQGVLLVSLRTEQPALVAGYAAADNPELQGLKALAVAPGERQLYTVGAGTDAEIAAWRRERGSRCPLPVRGGIGRQSVDIVAGGRLVYEVTGRVQPNASGETRYTVEVANPAAGQERNPADNAASDTDPLVPAPDLDVDKRLGDEQASLEPPVVAGRPVAWRVDLANRGISDAARAGLVDALPVFPDAAGGVVAGSGSWRCEANRPLAPLDPVASPGAISALAVGPRQRYLYAASSPDDALLVFDLAADGRPGDPSVIAETELAGASDVAVADDGLTVYVTGAVGDSLLVFERETLAAPLALAQRFTTVAGDTTSPAGLNGAGAVSISPDQQRVFVAGAESNAIAVFDRDPRTGRLTYLGRAGDGINTVLPGDGNPTVNVIEGVSDVHAAAGGDLYAVAGDSEAITRFRVDSESGNAALQTVWRAGDAGLPDLAGLRSIAAAPGDTHLYLLADAGVIVLRRDASGALAYEGLFDGAPGVGSASALAVDAAGSRAYLLVEADQGAVVHVLRRDWNDGSLEFWYSEPLNRSGARALAQAPDFGHLFAADASGALLRFDEQPLSRCRNTGEPADAVATELDLGAGGWAGFDIAAVVHPSARGDLPNTAEAAPSLGADPVPGNNSSSVSEPIAVISDIGITKSGPLEAIAGTTVEYVLTVTNAGPSDALGIRVRDPAPAGVAGVSWTCAATQGSSCPAQGSGAPDFAADVLVDGTLDIRLAVSIDPGYLGDLVNVAVLEPEVGASDPTTADHRAETVTGVIARPDVRVAKETVTDPVVAGLPVRYRVAVDNDGPSDAPDVAFTDLLPGALNGATWTCTSSAGASCPAGGAGSPSFDLALPAGSGVVVEVEGGVPADFVGELTNSAEAAVTAPAVDPDPSSNADSVTDPVVARADLALELTAPLNPFDPAGSLALPVDIGVTNAGPSRARDVRVLMDASAQVFPLTSGCTRPSATEIRCALPDLGPGEGAGVQLRLDRLPSAPATFDLAGLAGSAAVDPVAANDADAVSVELRSGVDLDVTVDNDRTWLSPDEVVEYTVRIRNIGSRDAPGAEISIPGDPDLLDLDWSCEPSAGAFCTAAGMGPISDTADLPAGAQLVYTVTGRVDPAVDLSVPVSIDLSASATATGSSEVNPANDVDVDQDDVRLVMFEDGFETRAAAPVATGAAATAATSAANCIDLDLAEATAGRAFSARLVESRTDNGRLLYWMDRREFGARDWVRLSVVGRSGFETSGWMAVSTATGAASLRVDAGVPALQLADGRNWTASAPVHGAIDRIQASAGVAAARCGNADAMDTRESK